jgi:hypothetical protein
LNCAVFVNVTGDIGVLVRLRYILEIYCAKLWASEWGLVNTVLKLPFPKGNVLTNRKTSSLTGSFLLLTVSCIAG